VLPLLGEERFVTSHEAGGKPLLHAVEEQILQRRSQPEDIDEGRIIQRRTKGTGGDGNAVLGMVVDVEKITDERNRWAGKCLSKVLLQPRVARKNKFP
jgi:hypothetical protein